MSSKRQASGPGGFGGPESGRTRPWNRNREIEIKETT